VYKLGITHRWLHLDHDGRAYFYRRDVYLEVPVVDAVDYLFEGIEEMGCTRRTPYTEEHRRQNYKKARDMGWTIIT
jgi:hypothetical protein